MGQLSTDCVCSPRDAEEERANRPISGVLSFRGVAWSLAHAAFATGSVVPAWGMTATRASCPISDPIAAVNQLTERNHTAGFLGPAFCSLRRRGQLQLVAQGDMGRVQLNINDRPRIQR
jgi:hypothetical protein